MQRLAFSILSAFVLLVQAQGFDVLSLTEEDFFEVTAGKTVFVKFFAPWCNHCQLLAWEQLAQEYQEDPVGLVAEVDCVSREGKPLCEYLDIRSFPTLMYGEPNHLEEYTGGRSLEELSAFAKENLVPLCSLEHLENCSEEEMISVNHYMAMSAEELEGLVEAQEERLTAAHETYHETLEYLQAQFEEAARNRDEEVAAIREGPIGLMRAVQKLRAVADGEEHDGTSKDEL
eukprot:Nitzschia sp. Nitz4//scaffold27_size158506//71414//72481//NITZ4_002599-RA/size158506-augustus-gene-0.21-mRNA-1//-1//CDS//3329545485//8400//frame0